MPADLKKGDLNKDFGFKINTPFHLISNLPDGRYLDLVSNNPVIKSRNGYPSQQWYFDQRSKTIHSMRTKSYSVMISGSGRSAKLAVGGTNSNWW
jgi:hypothetical protein